MVGAVRWRATARVIPGGDSGYGAWASAAKCWLAVGNREAREIRQIGTDRTCTLVTRN